ncbi:MAG: AMP-binding protein [Erysipelotrichaceae bacterium]|nr:AMP-binding protein [Erysipelotrichaceae bacterium]
MNLSFSTHGWSGYSWENLVDATIECGLNGIEIANDQCKEFAMPSGPLHKFNTASTVRYLREKNIKITCFNAGTSFADPATADVAYEEIMNRMEMAKNFGVKYVIIYAAKGGNVETAKEVLNKVLPVAEKEDIVILIKTSGMFANTSELKSLLDDFACDYLAASWNMYAPYREANEEPQKTIENLGAYVKHVHVCDSKVIDGVLVHELVGEGDLPIPSMVQALASVNYNGFMSLRWDPSWLEGLNDLDVILTHYATTINRYGNTARKKSHLYSNRAHTGEYIWKHDDLIDYTFGQLLDKVTETFPDQLCFKYTTLDYTRTYSQFRDDVDEFAKVLISMGVRPGKQVAVWATNVPQWYISFWAAAKIGAVLVTVNTAYKIHEIEYLLKQSDTHTLIMIDGWRDSHYNEIMKELCPEMNSTKPGEHLHCKRLPFLRNIITIGHRLPGCLTWEEALRRADSVSDEELHRYAASVNVNDVCNMQYTSGTTGFPKGVMLTHYNVVNNGKYIGDHMDLSTADRVMIQVPMFHCFGMVLSMTASMTHGATCYPLPYFSPKPALDCVHKERITSFNGVPTMFIAMIQHPDFAKTDFSSMRTGIMAGSNCPSELMRQVMDVMNMKELVSVYGQTESAPGDTMSSYYDSADVRADTVGSAFANVECKIIDPETGEDCPVGVDGEFVARGYNIMKGYYKMPKATAETIDKEGWLHTGDLARMDENGNYYITGRLKDMIIRGGENIYPKEIEEFLYTHPMVQDVQVIGVPDKKYGEEIMACIILKEGMTTTEPEMRAFITASLARHKVPRYIEFVDAFPMNAAGKILKYKMRDDAAKRLGLTK